MSFIEYLKENLFLVEKKDHLIKKIKNLTDDQKNELINFFNKNPHIENKIDWSNTNTLTYDDFKPLFDIRSKTKMIKSVKEKGISGLEEGKDYINFPISKGVAYIPLNYEASKLIASKRIGSCEGKWCTAYQKSKRYWAKYVFQKKVILIYILLDDTKYAVAVYPDNKNLKIFDAEDNAVDSIPGIYIQEEINSNLNIINKARQYIDIDNISVYEKFGISNYKENADGTVDVDDDVDISQNELEKIPIKFGKVSGSFYCSSNQLTTLEGAPKSVGLDFVCGFNQLTTLEGAPKSVGLDFVCSSNQLTTLEGAPRKVGGSFYCDGNPVEFTEEDVKKVCNVLDAIITDSDFK